MRKRLAFAGLLAVAASAQPHIGSCPVFPANNVWNMPVDQLPVASNSATLVATIGATTRMHADFGSGLWDGGPIGIPFVTVSGSQTKYPATFDYADDAIAIDTGNCILYELYAAYPQGTSWQAGSGAIYDLRSHALRTAGWTSADAAGLPIFPGLVRYDEVAAGEIRHAIRFTVPQTRRAYVWPARHFASSLTGAQYPPMGQRFRLRANFDITPYPQEVQVILRALKKYGLILADNGSAWYVSGAPDERWNNDTLATLRNVTGADFEAVDGSVFSADANSGQARSCDTDGDGVASVVDVQRAVNSVLGTSACGFHDIDASGACNVVDTQRIVNAVLGAACRVGP
jgi:hypothetical protein